jgi:CheY-like chemotaxis protein
MASQTSSEQRILLVDDDADSLDLLAKHLLRAGHIVKIATEAPAALAAIESFRPTIAIIDLGLPVMNGYELAREIRAISKCKLVAVSGYGRESAPGDTAVTSFDRHLIKPVDAAALIQTLRTLE